MKTLKKKGFSLARQALVTASVLTMMALLPTQTLAQSSSRTASTANPELANRHYNRGHTYNNMGRLEEALEEYRLSVAADSSFLDSFRNMGNIYMAMDRPEDAIPNYIRFVNLYEGAPDTALRSALGNIGNYYRDIGRFDLAQEYDVRLVRADRTNRDLVFHLINAYQGEEMYAAAAEILETTLELNPTDAFLHRTLGRMYEELDRLEDALVSYRRAANIDLGTTYYRTLIRETEERLEWQRQRDAGETPTPPEGS
jgi:tetratricopeptide (TPR) repeat protein